jgi:hypothetical protein
MSIGEALKNRHVHDTQKLLKAAKKNNQKNNLKQIKTDQPFWS